MATFLGRVHELLIQSRSIKGKLVFGQVVTWQSIQNVLSWLGRHTDLWSLRVVPDHGESLVWNTDRVKTLRKGGPTCGLSLVLQRGFV